MIITPVPFEFVGLGRSFRDRIVNADSQAVQAMISVFTPLARRAERSSVSRPELLQDAVRLWRQKMPSFGLLDSNIQLSRRELYIREVRIGAGTTCAPWNAAVEEPVISIILVELHVAKDICLLRTDTVALLPLHALGRWYQRSLVNSDAALLADLAQLAGAYGKILPIDAPVDNLKFLWPTTGGQWAGSIMERLSEATGREEQVLNVRTFLPHSAKTSADRPAAPYDYRRGGSSGSFDSNYFKFYHMPGCG